MVIDTVIWPPCDVCVTAIALSPALGDVRVIRSQVINRILLVFGQVRGVMNDVYKHVGLPPHDVENIAPRNTREYTPMPPEVEHRG